MSLQNPGDKFDPNRAAEYATQSRIALAGYDACHELAACMLAAAIGTGNPAHLLIAGAGGTGSEVVAAGRLAPLWRFTAVDPSRPMLDLARGAIEAAGLGERTTWVSGDVRDVDEATAFDGATLIGVLHHLPGDERKLGILRDIAARLKPGAPLVLACNHYAYASQPVLLAAWGKRWTMHGETAAGVKARLGKILQGADPPHSEQAIESLLTNAGFGTPLRFFSSLFWGAWLVNKAG